MKAWISEATFAARRTSSAREGCQLLAHTAHFHLANRGLAKDRSTKLPIKVQIGDQWRPLTVRTGMIGDLYILYEVLAFGAYQLPSDLVPPDTIETIVDCGANIGMTSLYFASKYPRARIFSIEADPDNFALLRENTASEARITPVHGCVVAAPQATVYFDNQGPAWGRQSSTTGKGVGIPGITIDQLMSRFAIDRIDLLKMDIEGAESEVLATGSYLDAVQHIVAELHGTYGISDFGRDVAAHGLDARAPDGHGQAVTAHRRHRSAQS
jgi:FkbM family methyltransferase